jgi:hypothetical protein
MQAAASRSARTGCVDLGARHDGVAELRNPRRRVRARALVPSLDEALEQRLHLHSRVESRRRARTKAADSLHTKHTRSRGTGGSALACACAHAARRKKEQRTEHIRLTFGRPSSARSKAARRNARSALCNALRTRSTLASRTISTLHTPQRRLTYASPAIVGFSGSGERKARKAVPGRAVARRGTVKALSPSDGSKRRLPAASA